MLEGGGGGVAVAPSWSPRPGSWTPGRSAIADASPEALAVLRKKGGAVRRPASTTSVSGTRSPTSRSAPATSPRAGDLFDRVRLADPAFADVAERLAALG